MSYEQYVNNAQTTTTASINNTSNPVTFSVTSASAFPTSGNFRVLIDAEILLVTSVSGTSFTASRAQEGTTIANHSSGATVTNILTAGSLKQLVTDRNLSGTMANLPAAGVAGRTYKCTDNGYEGLDNGTSWSWWYHGHPVTLPPTSGWSWANQSNATVSQTTGSVLLYNLVSNGGSDNLNCYFRPVPSSTPYTLEWCYYNYWYFPGGSQNTCCGPILLDSTETYAMLWRTVQNTTPILYYSNWPNIANAGGVGNAFALNAPLLIANGPVWVRMHDDGTNRNWYYGPNQNSLILQYSESRTANMTAAYYGVALDAYSSAVGLELVHLAGG